MNPSGEKKREVLLSVDLLETKRQWVTILMNKLKPGAQVKNQPQVGQSSRGNSSPQSTLIPKPEKEESAVCTSLLVIMRACP